MNLFTWLLLGHCIGDWMLQNDWMAQHKQCGLVNRACFVHVTVYTFAILLALWVAAPANLTPLQLGLFLLCVYASHWLIDATDAAGRWAHVFRQSDMLLVRIMVDQTFHLVVLGLLIEFLLS